MSLEQFYNKKLTKNQIEMLNNINIKYDTVKNEIDAKLNNLINVLLNDLSSFFENIEIISNEKLKEYDNIQRECDILSSKLKEKTLNEEKLKNNIESLQEEILFLKNENKNKTNETISLSSTRIIPTKNIFKKHTKGNSEVIISNLDNSLNLNKFNSINNLKKNIFENLIKRDSRKKKQNSLIKLMKGRIRDENSIDKNKTIQTNIFNEKKDILNLSNPNDKMREKMKIIAESKTNIKIKNFNEIKVNKNNKFKYKFKSHKNIGNNTKNNSLDLKEEKSERKPKNEKEEIKVNIDKEKKVKEKNEEKQKNKKKDEIQIKKINKKRQDDEKKIDNQIKNNYKKNQELKEKEYKPKKEEVLKEIKEEKEKEIREEMEEDIDSEGQIEINKKFEAAERFLQIVESLKDYDRNINNYSEDDYDINNENNNKNNSNNNAFNKSA